MYEYLYNRKKNSLLILTKISFFHIYLPFKTNIRFKEKLNRNFHTMIVKFQMHEIDRNPSSQSNSQESWCTLRLEGAILFSTVRPGCYRMQISSLLPTTFISQRNRLVIWKKKWYQRIHLKQVVRKAYLWRASLSTSW